MKLKLLVLASVLLLSSCADNVGFNIIDAPELVGFWHGMIAPIAWLVSLFNDDVAIYAIYNNGGWYDFGFVWGIGGSSKTIYSNRKKS